MSNLKKTLKLADMEIWNDSCSVEELRYAIEHGATGATTNPVIVLNVLKQEMNLWEDRIHELIKTMKDATEIDIAWKLIEEMAVKGSELLRPVFDETKGKKGRISIQTNAQLYRDAEAMATQAIHFNTLAPNMMVKMPTTAAGIKAMEEATYHGVNLNATVSFTVAQSIAVAEAVERGIKRREAEGKDCSFLTPVCTLMVGRLDDWVKVAAAKDGVLGTPGAFDWAGVAAFKKACEIYKARGYKTRMLAAAYRNHYHWSELIGDDVVLTVPSKWQKLFNGNEQIVPERSLTEHEVPEWAMKELLAQPEFVKGYEEDGMTPEEFDTYGATMRTLRGFLDGYSNLLALIRNMMIPNPDL